MGVRPKKRQMRCPAWGSLRSKKRPSRRPWKKRSTSRELCSNTSMRRQASPATFTNTVCCCARRCWWAERNSLSIGARAASAALLLFGYATFRCGPFDPRQRMTPVLRNPNQRSAREHPVKGAEWGLNDKFYLDFPSKESHKDAGSGTRID
jgi:hypothetical protein